MPLHRPLASRRLLSLALILALGAPAHAFGASASSAVADKRAEAARAQAEMKRMQTELAAGMDDYVKVSTELAAVRRQVGSNSRRLRLLQSQLTTIEGRLGDRAAYMYRTRDTGTLDVLFGATSFDEFLQRFDILSRIADEDASLISRARRARVEARRLRSLLRSREARLMALRDKSASERDQLSSSLAKQHAYFDSLSSDVAALLASQERASRPPASTPASKPRRHPRTGNGLAAATVDGRSGTYYVMADEPTSYRPTGVGMDTQASMYGTAETGTHTASGRPLDDTELTCAHKTLPFGTRVAITRGSRRIICVVTDRGPYSPPGRDLDLTLRAAALLGIDGVGHVHYEVVVPSS